MTAPAVRTKICERCGIVQRGEYNRFPTCRNTEACQRRAAKNTPRKHHGGTVAAIQKIAGHKNPAAVSLGRKGGQVTSEAKAQAARANGAKGGRPPLPTLTVAEEKTLRLMAYLAIEWESSLAGAQGTDMYPDPTAEQEQTVRNCERNIERFKALQQKLTAR